MACGYGWADTIFRDFHRRVGSSENEIIIDISSTSPSISPMSTRLLSTLVMAAICSFGALQGQQISEEQAQKLFNSEASLEEFTKAAEEAAKAGVPAQLLAEAKLVWGLRNANTDYLTKILP
jgi:hypothetical protein